MKQLSFTSRANADLTQILDYIELDRPQTATKVVARIREKCELLRTNPEMGPARPEFAKDMRSLIVQRWIVYYRVKTNEIQVIRVLDGARDVRGLFG